MDPVDQSALERGDADTAALLERLSVQLARRARRIGPVPEVPRPLYVGLRDVAGGYVCVDLVASTVCSVPRGVELPLERFEIRYWAEDLRQTLAGRMSWEDLSLTFRQRITRFPDGYARWENAFLTLQTRDLPAFARRMREPQAERIVVTTPAGKYEVDRYCPHIGADLSRAWFYTAEPNFLVCPLHYWLFDLSKQGACTSSPISIHALEVQ